ncbi:MAG: hypothetical protein WB562_13140 [Candidatus Sulfotelmatobacter sp.]
MKYKLRTKPKTKQGDPDGQNRERSEWALVALAAFQNATGTDDGDALSDLLCDLMHLEDYITGDFEGFESALNRAKRHYRDETAAEECAHTGRRSVQNGVPYCKQCGADIKN